MNQIGGVFESGIEIRSRSMSQSGGDIRDILQMCDKLLNQPEGW